MVIHYCQYTQKNKYLKLYLFSGLKVYFKIIIINLIFIAIIGCIYQAE